MVSLEAPIVTRFLIKKVDMRNLKIRSGEERTEVQIGYFTRKSLGISRKYEELACVFDKIKQYQEKHPPKVSILELPEVLDKHINGQRNMGLTGFLISTGVAISALQLGYNTAMEYAPLGFGIFSLGLALGLTGFTRFLLSVNREQLANDFLHYFIKANTGPSGSE